jgi:phosphoglycerate-specific signal transduction histidine kinase
MTDTFTKKNIWDVSHEYTEPVILSSRGKASLNVLPDKIIEKMSTSLKITLRQGHTAYAIWLLGKIEEFIKSKLEKSDASELNRQIASLEGIYRSIVKRSLLQMLREKDDRFNYLSIEEQQEKLEDSFISTVCHYRTFL